MVTDPFMILVIQSAPLLATAWIFLSVNPMATSRYLTKSPLEAGPTDELREGGTAMSAYMRLQFEDMPDFQRQAIKAALLRYCELDTLAMVMVMQAWGVVPTCRIQHEFQPFLGSLAVETQGMCCRGLHSQSINHQQRPVRELQGHLMAGGAEVAFGSSAAAHEYESSVGFGFCCLGRFVLPG
jgi:hypothetical protein